MVLWDLKDARAFTSEAVTEGWQASGFGERFVGRYGQEIAFIP
jgi:hypothetical protein